jgi:hypothetical protein
VIDRGPLSWSPARLPEHASKFGVKGFSERVFAYPREEVAVRVAKGIGGGSQTQRFFASHPCVLAKPRVLEADSAVGLGWHVDSCPVAGSMAGRSRSRERSWSRKPTPIQAAANVAGQS